jgi:hypothetical protein
MAISADALVLEQRSVDRSGKPALGEAYELLRDQWRSGDRDRELALHLMFLAWYLTIEPPFLTGLDARRTPSDELPAAFLEVHGHFEASIESDVEMLYVVGLMAHLCAWCIGDVDSWDARSLEYKPAYRQLAPDGLSPSLFEGRGLYGHYFAGHAKLGSAGY